MTDPAAILAGCLPQDPTDPPSGIGVPTAAVCGVLAELIEHRKRQARRDFAEAAANGTLPDGGA